MLYGIDIGGKNLKIAKYNLRSKKFSCYSIPLFSDLIRETLIREIKNPTLIIATETISANRKFSSSFRLAFNKLTNILLDLPFNDRIFFVSNNNKLLNLKQSKRYYWEVICKNWISSSYLFTHYFNTIDNGILIDCGTSSTDIIPIFNNFSQSLSDKKDYFYNRFNTGEIVWSGLLFTPIFNFCNYIELKNNKYTLNPTTKLYTGDLYLINKAIDPNSLNKNTRIKINNKYNTKIYWRDNISIQKSMESLRALILIDKQFINKYELKNMSKYLIKKQKEQIEYAFNRVIKLYKKKYKIIPRNIVLIGGGRNIILKSIFKDFQFEIIDGTSLIEKKLSGKFIKYEPNCETALGCLLISKSKYFSKI